jgi:hypothetical protein
VRLSCLIKFGEYAYLVPANENSCVLSDALCRIRCGFSSEGVTFRGAEQDCCWFMRVHTQPLSDFWRFLFPSEPLRRGKVEVQLISLTHHLRVGTRCCRVLTEVKFNFNCSQTRGQRFSRQSLLVSSIPCASSAAIVRYQRPWLMRVVSRLASCGRNACSGQSEVHSRTRMPTRTMLSAQHTMCSES